MVSRARQIIPAAFLGVVAIAAAVSAMPSSAATPTQALPAPRLSVTFQSSLRGTPSVLVRSITVVSSPSATYRVACRSCRRSGQGTIVTRRRPRGGRTLTKVGWTVTAQKRIVIRVTSLDRLGWLYSIGISGAKTRPKLVYRHAACLGPRGGEAVCPRGTVAPAAGQTVGSTLRPAAPAPVTTIDSGPSGTKTTRPVAFTYSSSLSGSTFECSLDGVGWQNCPSAGISYASMADGNHVFSVRARSGGVVDGSPPTRKWLQRTPPSTAITSGPSGTSAVLPVTFTYESSDPSPTFECRLDGGAWAACSSSGTTTYDAMSVASHTFSVRSTSSGLTDLAPPSRSWTQAAQPTPPPPVATPPPPAEPPPPPAYYTHHVYGTCRDGACGLRVRTGPGFSNYPFTHVIYDGDQVDVVCQTTGENVSNGSASSSVWDRQTDGSWVTDFYIDTPNIGTFSPPIPHC